MRRHRKDYAQGHGGITGEMAFAQTSLSGRFGRARIQNLNGKLNERPYAEILAGDPVGKLFWLVRPP